MKLTFSHNRSVLVFVRRADRKGRVSSTRARSPLGRELRPSCSGCSFATLPQSAQSAQLDSGALVHAIAGMQDSALVVGGRQAGRYVRTNGVHWGRD